MGEHVGSATKTAMGNVGVGRVVSVDVDIGMGCCFFVGLVPFFCLVSGLLPIVAANFV